jgi:spore maturation protein CgeB
MMNLNIVVIGLSVTSSWGNGHATTYRALLGALARLGHRITFLERDQPWYRTNRDLVRPADWQVKLYHKPQDIPARFGKLIAEADLVVIGSYVPDGVAIAEWVTAHAQGLTAFYDIDTPVTLAELEKATSPYITAAMIPRFDLYLSFSGGPVPGMIEDLYGSPMARALYCSADPKTHKPQAKPAKWTLGYLGTFSKDRQSQLEDLLLTPARQLAEHRFAVAGSQYPPALAWPGNVERIEHLSPQRHSTFYSEQRFTLNVTRADMRTLGFSPSVRLFEAAACGVPIISDRWPGLETIFRPGSEILLASTPGEVIQILRDMPEERRRAIGEKAHDRLLNDHTPDRRARQLEAFYLEALSRRSRKPARPQASLLRASVELPAEQA